MTITKKARKGKAPFIGACLFPSLLLISVFILYPTLSIFRVSLFKWGGYSPEKIYVGFNNYKTLFTDARFWRAFSNSLILMVVVTVATLILSLWCAAVLSRERIRGKGFFRIVFYIPNILSTVVIAAVFSAIYDPSRGLLNSLIFVFDPDSLILWLGDRSLVIYSIAIAMVWQAVGYYMVMYLAAMSAVPESLYEAAELEGSGRTRCFFSVTLPMIRENLRTTLTFFVISNINVSFLLVRAMTGGGPDGASEVLLSYMYKQAYTNSSYGYGMAIGVVVFLFSFALALFVNRLTYKKEA